MPPKGYKSINVSERGFSQLEFICDRLGKSKSQFMSELLEQVFDIFSDLKPKTTNIYYLATGNNLIINAVGQSYLITGTRPVCEEIREREAKAPAIVKIYGKVEEKTELEGEKNG